MTVAVLGAGPAGLFAAHAATRAGAKVTIYSVKWKSKMFGAMYLHRAIPGITPENPELEINIIKVGYREGYATNVYGYPDAPSSWDHFTEGAVPGWSLTKAYDRLWDFYSDLIHNATVDKKYLESVIRPKYDVIFSTIPRTHLCQHPADHEFKAQKIWVQHGDASDRLIPRVNDRDMMYYNGFTPDLTHGIVGPEWYRFSQINKYQSWEYSKPPPVSNEELEMLRQQISTGIKPLWTTCTCHPDVHFIGRFGKWQKGVLTHHAYEEVELALQ